MMNDNNLPPGQPGIVPRWTSSAKNGVGTAINSGSRVWFTLSHGIVNEVYYPNIDQANIRDLGFIITDGKEFFSEEKRDTQHEIKFIEQGAPAYVLTNTCHQGCYRTTKTIIADPVRDVLIQQVKFEALKGNLDDYRLYALLAPHIDNQGIDNNGWAGDYKGMQMLFARREGTTLALACSLPFQAVSCGYAGKSDGWLDLRSNFRLTQFYPQATAGNIALTAQIDLAKCEGKFRLVLAFGANPEEAGQRARAALLQDFENILDSYLQEWQTFQASCLNLDNLEETKQKEVNLYRVSTMVLKTHEAKRFPGGFIASLSIPWGNARGDKDLGGYHLVWPRDLIESAGGLLAAGQEEEARRAIIYLMSTQEADGHWLQNMWLDGQAYWQGLQMDETALFVLLADTMKRKKRLRNLGSLAGGAESDRLRGPEWSGNRRGALGGGPRLLAFYSCY